MIEENLLIELVTEELPPQSQKELGESFGKNIFEGLIDHKLINASKFEVYSTPRRLGVKITKVLAEAITEKKLIKLMPKKIGFDNDGNAQQALIKKLKSIGEEESSLSKIISKEGEFKFANNEDYLNEFWSGNLLPFEDEKFLTEKAISNTNILKEKFTNKNIEDVLYFYS